MRLWVMLLCAFLSGVVVTCLIGIAWAALQPAQGRIVCFSPNFEHYF